MERYDTTEQERVNARGRRPLPSGSAERKGIPITTGVLDYFPAALAEVARVSKAGNDKHNPGEPMHHARGKSTDHADSIARHLVERGNVDPDTGVRHSAELAWRALALLQQELEDAGLAPLARGAKTVPGVTEKPYQNAQRDVNRRTINVDRWNGEGPEPELWRSM